MRQCCLAFVEIAVDEQVMCYLSLDRDSHLEDCKVLLHAVSRILSALARDCWDLEKKTKQCFCPVCVLTLKLTSSLAGNNDPRST